MTWQALNRQPPENDERDLRLRQELSTTLERSPELLKFLLATLRSGTYMSGRTLDQVAFGEGQRALARTLLQYGGKIHAQENEQENSEEG